MKKWVTDYTAKYGTPPIYSSAQAYDILYFITKVGGSRRDRCSRPRC